MRKSCLWDAVLLINASFIKNPRYFYEAYFTKRMVKCLLHKPDNIFLSACGIDVPFTDYWSKRSWKNADLIPFFNNFCSESEIRHHYRCISFANKIIPVMYQYAEAWRSSVYAKNIKVLETIPLPVNCEKYTYSNILKDKIVVFHGINRPNEKGSKYIIEAMNRIQNEYPTLVDCKVVGGIPLQEYLAIMDQTNIVIDQTYSDYVGLNGLFAMAMGKVVLSGNEPENRKELGIEDIPIINIEPNTNQIYQELKRLILDRELILSLSKRSYAYVRQYHNSQAVARKYVSLIESFC